MTENFLRAHDLPVPAPYRAAAVVTGLVVFVCCATATWLPWFVEDAGLFAGPAGFVDRGGMLGLGAVVGALLAPAPALALRWPAFGIAVALLPVVATGLDPSSAPLHFAVVAALCGVAVSASWRRPLASLAALGTACLVVGGWLLSGVDMAAPFAATIYLDQTPRRVQTGVVYLVALAVVLAFSLWFRTVALHERQRRRLAAREGEVADQAAVVAERARLARDLHDVVAHHVSLIAVRAETAPYTEPELGEAGQRVLAEVAGEARLALDELRGVLGILGRAGEAERSPQPTLADVEALVERTRRSGQEVRLVGDVGSPVGAAAGYAAYRVVQESLTNARKHAPDAEVEVAVEATPRLLEVRVSNAVDHPPTHLDGGRGLAGMRERAEALGGRLRIHAAGSRFEVVAVVPTGDPDAA
ncbi:hypothetical protein ASE01_02040 [Nocardioides sp. Root190]|uniref:sensor histidine kinase n=1 Tax=Nocardioides sp. Root190 TaxID=1736488 RepID=UPI0006F546BD|nr:histidine kinase [Nocardioides sp. Root190]KRB80292.1 hypothetical protein ASE01_02040 [Nocardioides sp. Root190]